MAPASERSSGEPQDDAAPELSWARGAALARRHGAAPFPDAIGGGQEQIDKLPCIKLDSPSIQIGDAYPLPFAETREVNFQRDSSDVLAHGVFAPGRLLGDG
jgi:hypothetical protein